MAHEKLVSSADRRTMGSLFSSIKQTNKQTKQTKKQATRNGRWFTDPPPPRRHLVVTAPTIRVRPHRHLASATRTRRWCVLQGGRGRRHLAALDGTGRKEKQGHGRVVPPRQCEKVTKRTAQTTDKQWPPITESRRQQRPFLDALPCRVGDDGRAERVAFLFGSQSLQRRVRR